MTVPVRDLRLGRRTSCSADRTLDVRHYLTTATLCLTDRRGRVEVRTVKFLAEQRCSFCGLPFLLGALLSGLGGLLHRGPQRLPLPARRRRGVGGFPVLATRGIRRVEWTWRNKTLRMIGITAAGLQLAISGVSLVAIVIARDGGASSGAAACLTTHLVVIGGALSLFTLTMPWLGIAAGVAGSGNATGAPTRDLSRWPLDG